MTFLENPLSPSEQRLQNERIARAYFDLLSSILGREPTQEEMFGLTDISKTIKRKFKKIDITNEAREDIVAASAMENGGKR